MQKPDRLRVVKERSTVKYGNADRRLIGVAAAVLVPNVCLLRARSIGRAVKDTYVLDALSRRPVFIVTLLRLFPILTMPLRSGRPFSFDILMNRCSSFFFILLFVHLLIHTKLAPAIALFIFNSNFFFLFQILVSIFSLPFFKNIFNIKL